MAGNKVHVLILFGGKSAEHEVSILSARNIYQALDKNKYDVTLAGIDRDGRWYINSQAEKILNTKNPSLLQLNEAGPQVTLLQTTQIASALVSKNSEVVSKPIDVVFPILHGPNGEDGTVQGLMKLMNVPFVGPSVLGSAVGMDKDVMKRLLKEAKIPIGKFKVIRASQYTQTQYKEFEKELRSPMFVKPANMGSSVGVSKVKNESDFKKAIDEAFKYDTKVIVEEYIEGREIECAVLGNENPKASLPGEVVNNTEFYSYEAKYIDEKGATIVIPAKLEAPIVKRIQELAIQTFQVLECEGMGRVDFFLKKNGDVYVNEINTIPGFTKISMYPKMWEASGLSYAQLIDELIRLGLERHKRDSLIKNTPDLKGDGFNA